MTNNLIQEIENNANIDINLIEEVLAFTRNIHATYLQAPKYLKRHYLRFFFEKLIVKDKKIEKIVYTPIFSVLQANHAVIIKNFELPLKDLFINRELEFDYTLDDFKILYSNLNLNPPRNYAGTNYL